MKTKHWKWFFLLGCIITLIPAADLIGAESYKIGIIRSPGIYATEIRDGFKAELGTVPLNLVYLDEQGFAEEEFARMNVAIAEKFIRQKVDLIVTIGSSATQAVAGRFKGSGIPILFIGITDPVTGGLIEKLNEPSGTNLTGVTFPLPVWRTLGVMFSMFPAARTFCFVYNSHLPPDALYVRWIREYAEKNPTPNIRFLDTNEDRGIPSEELKAADVFFGWYSVHLYQFAGKYLEVPFVGNTLQGCREGAVVSIYPKLPELGAQAAKMAYKILNEKISPGEIPSEQPQKYGLCFNIKRIKDLNLKIPKGFFDLADARIE